MTAEVAIINRHAIALAADSAVTLEQGSNTKVFTSSNKIFNVSNCLPIGVMIYGSSDFMGLPWETVIKVFRKKVKGIEFDALKDFYDYFVNFVREEANNNSTLKSQYIHARIISILDDIVGNFIFSLDSLLTRRSSLSVAETRKILRDVVAADLEVLLEGGKWQSIERRARQFLKLNKSRLESEIDNRLGDLSENNLRSSIVKIVCCELFGDKVNLSKCSGIVFCGFGHSEMLPSLVHCSIEHHVYGYLKFNQHQTVLIGEDVEAGILPFAQHDMIARFMDGIDPRFERDLKSMTAELLSENSSLILNGVYKDQNGQRQEIIKIIERLNLKMASNFMDHVKRKKGEFHSPIVDMVSHLPKEEMAAMAESLVTIMAIRKKVSIQSDTVGGPVDVAVITKGDGFVWINRKHYFDREKNYDFFKRKAQDYQDT